jgi:heme oxygenase (mycobilin-producing)
VLSVTHYAADDTFEVLAADALAALAARPGYVRGSVGRSTDDPRQWVMVTEWRDVGSYRRALGNYDVKLRATPLLGSALDQPSAFEQLVEVGPSGAATIRGSDRA